VKNALRLLFGAIFLAAGAVAVGFALAGFWLGVVLAFLWSGFWIVSIVRRAFSFGSLALVGYSLLAFFAVTNGAWAGWLLLALLAALAGWSLEYLVYKLLLVEDEAVAAEMTASHIRRLGPALGLGLLITGAALLVHYRSSFWLALVIGSLAVIGLTRFIALIRQARS
jgi:hypothetical protein